MMWKFWLSREERTAMDRERTMALLRKRYERLPSLIAQPSGSAIYTPDNDVAAAVREAIKDWDDLQIAQFFTNLDGRFYD